MLSSSLVSSRETCAFTVATLMKSSAAISAFALPSATAVATSDESATHRLRLVSEALTNIAKYARATTVTVSAAHEAGHLVVEIVDDGVGGADSESGSGLRGLADRVEALDGRLRVWTPRGGGTRVRAELPCG